MAVRGPVGSKKPWTIDRVAAVDAYAGQHAVRVAACEAASPYLIFVMAEARIAPVHAKRSRRQALDNRDMKGHGLHGALRGYAGKR